MNFTKCMRGFVINKKYADVEIYSAYFLFILIFLSRY